MSKKKDSLEKEVVTVKTDEEEIIGQNKCPKCGATDISYNETTQKLRCNFCRYEFKAKKVKGLKDTKDLDKTVITSGAQDIINAETIITLKCESCGAEVVVDTANSASARCHWCRNTLSINKQIPNGAIPDVILPFSIKKDEAKDEINKFVKKRAFFAHPKFKKEFTTDNIMAVYFPYLLVDVNAHAYLSGTGEHQTRMYTVGSDEHKETYYDADAYHVERDFDITIDDLSIESNKDRLDTASSSKTNNIINSIMPFDTENCVKFDANYLKNCTSEKRDVNVGDLDDVIDAEAKDIAKFAVNDTLKEYDRGVAWEKNNLKIKGKQWEAAYLPVWLYSYQQVKRNKKVLHYVAVNARTKETMGSVPINMTLLTIISAIVEFFGILLAVFLYDGDSENNGVWLLAASGFVFFIIMYQRYRNNNARHHYESETKKEVTNLKKVDQFIEHRKRLKNRYIKGRNNNSVDGEKAKSKFNSSVVKSFAEKLADDNDGLAKILKDEKDKD